MVLDAQGRIGSANPGATRILRVPLAGLRRPAAWREIAGLQAFAADRAAQFDASLGGDGANMGWTTGSSPLRWVVRRTQAGRGRHADAGGARGRSCPAHACLLVFDDISEIVSAQRAQAWGEVARRLAHEIKNPLTPDPAVGRAPGSTSSTASWTPAEQALLTKSVKHHRRSGGRHEAAGQ
jgi:nitrogen fixation/metabolism regulation signal transduction histidine kinase